MTSVCQWEWQTTFYKFWASWFGHILTSLKSGYMLQSVACHGLIGRTFSFLVVQKIIFIINDIIN